MLPTPSIPSPGQLSDAAANLFDKLFRGGLADLRPTPAQIIHEEPQCTVFRYLRSDSCPDTALPVLLVPPLAAPAVCFDLRRGHSIAEHLLGLGHPTYLVEYGAIAFSDRDLGLEHWVEDVIPTAVRRVSEQHGGAPVQLVGWCLGGIMSVLAAAGDPDLPIDRIACVASPFDFTRVRLMAPIRPIANLTNGLLVTDAVPGARRRAVAARAPRVQADVDRQGADEADRVATNLHDRDFLAQLEAVDRFMGSMHAYPGGRSASSTTSSSASTRSPAGASCSPTTRSTSPTCACRSCRWRGRPTSSRLRARCTISASCCPTRRRSGWRPRPAATSAS
jgi:polyhydroxyalkanoate synthase